MIQKTDFKKFLQLLLALQKFIPKNDYKHKHCLEILLADIAAM